MTPMAVVATPAYVVARGILGTHGVAPAVAEGA